MKPSLFLPASPHISETVEDVGLDPSAAENSRRRKFYGRQKSAANICGGLQSAVKVLFVSRRHFLAKSGGDLLCDSVYIHCITAV